MSQRLLRVCQPLRALGAPRSVLSTFSVVSVMTLTTLSLQAAEEAPAGGLSPFAGDLGNAIWTVAIFLLVVIVLGKFAWGPVLGMLRQREEFIHRSLADAKRDREEAEKRLKEHTANLQNARVEAMGIVEEARRDAERLREELKQKAKTEAETIVRNAQRQIQLETGRALQQIRHEAADLSVMIASKLIQRNLSKEDNDRLIEEALRQVETRPLG